MILSRLRRHFVLAAAIGVATWIGLAPPIASAAPFALPDLQIAYTGDVRVAPGQSFSYSVKMFNTGAATPVNQQISIVGGLPAGFQILKMTGSTGVVCEFVNDAQIALEGRHPLWACTVSRPMLSGASVVATAKAKAPAVAGQHLFDAFADYTNAVSEVSETNNSTQVTFRVQ